MTTVDPSVLARPQPMASKASKAIPTAFVVVFLSLCIPVFFSLGGLHLSLSRIVLLALFPYLFFQVYTGKCGRVLWVDIGMLLFVLALALSVLVNNSDVFVTFVGSNAIIILGGYMAGRCFIRTPENFIAFIKLFGVILLFTLPLALYESQTSHMVIPRLLDKLPMITSSADVHYQPRNGLHRTQVLFTHPIHYGLFASMCFALIFIGFRGVLGTGRRLGWAACVMLCCFTSVSSGPFLSMLTQLCLIFYGWVAFNLKNRWYVLLGSFSVLYFVLDIFSSRPAYFAIVERLAFNSHTAQVRRILLDYGLAQVGRTPWLGVGYNDWDLPDFMSGSLDNYWLLTALVYGVPAFAFLFSAFIYTLIKLGRRDFTAEPVVADLRLAFSLVIVSLMLTLATVAIWSDIATLVFLFLGSGIWMVEHTVRDAQTAATDPDPVAARTPTYSRFTNTPARPATNFAVRRQGTSRRETTGYRKP